MPATAKQVAKKEGLKFEEKKLTRDPSYNIRLGSAYLQELIDRFRGSYILAIAGYNAGPSRSLEWIRQYGDPRDADVDVIDWIESIPFSEPRNRSEERRVGTEWVRTCRSRGSPDQSNKKKKKKEYN